MDRVYGYRARYACERTRRYNWPVDQRELRNVKSLYCFPIQMDILPLPYEGFVHGPYRPQQLFVNTPETAIAHDEYMITGHSG